MDVSSFFPLFLPLLLLSLLPRPFHERGTITLLQWLTFQGLLLCLLQIFFHIILFLELCLMFKWNHKQVKKYMGIHFIFLPSSLKRCNIDQQFSLYYITCIYGVLMCQALGQLLETQQCTGALWMRAWSDSKGVGGPVQSVFSKAVWRSTSGFTEECGLRLLVK